MAQSADSDGTGDHRGRDEIVLVVDDDEAVAELNALMLERRGLKAEYVTSSSAALDELADRLEEIRAVVSDYQMPGRTGLDLLDAVRDQYPDMPFILFTGRGSEEIASEAIANGVTDYLQKGTDETYDLLANRVQNAIDRERVQHELNEVEARFNILIQNTDFGVISVDATGTIRFACDTVGELFGYPPQDLVDEPITRLIPERLVDSHRDPFQEYQETRQRTLDWDWVEFPALCRDGSERLVRLTFGEHETIQRHYVTAILRDVPSEEDS